MTANLHRLFFKPAAEKPKITSVPPEVWFLILILCLVFLEIGTYLGHTSGNSRGDILNLVVAAMLGFNWLAAGFKWSPRMAVTLRGVAFCSSVVGSAFVFWRCL